MSDLRPKTRELLARAAKAGEPTRADATRVRARMASKVAIGGALGATGLGLSGKVLAAVALVGALGAGALATRARVEVAHETGPEANATRTPIPIATPKPTPTPTPIPIATPKPTPTPIPIATPTPTPTPTAKTPPPTTALADELVLIRSIDEALAVGAPARAIALLDEHDQRFPTGMLREEADAERVRALCDAGHRAEARALAARFVAAHPRSIHVATLQRACADGAGEGE